MAGTQPQTLSSAVFCPNNAVQGSTIVVSVATRIPGAISPIGTTGPGGGDQVVQRITFSSAGVTATLGVDPHLVSLDKQLLGDFRGLTPALCDPLVGQPFPGPGLIPPNRLGSVYVLTVTVAPDAALGSSDLIITTTSGDTIVAPKVFEVRSSAGDYDDSGPTQSGYAVVTPSSSTATLAVFETFGLKRVDGTTQAGVLPASMTKNAIVFVSSSAPVSRNLALALVNPGNAAANVTATLQNENGTILATNVLTLNARQQRSQFITDLFATQTPLLTDLTGTLRIASDLPVALVGLRFRGANFSTLPITNLSIGTLSLPEISTGVGGANAVLLPQYATGGGWATEIVVENLGTTSETARVDLFKQDGTPLVTKVNGLPAASSFTNLSIPAGGVITLAPRDANGVSRF